MTITEQVRQFLDTNDDRVTGRIGATRLFGDTCDECDEPSLLLTETRTPQGCGAIVAGGIYCLDHGVEAVDQLTWSDADQITVTIPAHLLATDLAA
ncbi:hypothetical protein IU443_28560 [Nocardia farcinica]|uniref:hypothetical protein n=1 Tax=Nocardia farcinica TaxID=37329 RepID=UPI0018941922|nr:hypothetical protein [Nocardia farcinica]MBF6393885.1 hypothetical protein [Nocardia farcinica]